MSRRASLVGSIIKLSQGIQSYERKQERHNLINNYSGGPKEQPPTFSLQSFEFNPETRATKISILQTQQYRTIDRYVTENYVRYPIYSNWKTKTKIIAKSIKLTNDILESLNNNSDEYIKMFCFEIVERLNDESLLPSWYLNDIIDSNEKQKVDELNEWKKNANLDFNKNSKSIENAKKAIQSACSGVSKFLDNDKTLLYKTNRKIEKINKSSKSLVFKIISCGIYAYLVSNKRLNKLTKIAKTAEDNISHGESFVVNCNNISKLIEDNVARRNRSSSLINRTYCYKKEIESKNAEYLRKQVSPLTDEEDD